MKSLDLRYYVKCQTINGQKFVSKSVYTAAIILVTVNLTKACIKRVFTRSDRYLGAMHALEHVATYFCSYPPESLVESISQACPTFSVLRAIFT